MVSFRKQHARREALRHGGLLKTGFCPSGQARLDLVVAGHWQGPVGRDRTQNRACRPLSGSLPAPPECPCCRAPVANIRSARRPTVHMTGWSRNTRAPPAAMTYHSVAAAIRGSWRRAEIELHPSNTSNGRAPTTTTATVGPGAGRVAVGAGLLVSDAGGAGAGGDFFSTATRGGGASFDAAGAGASGSRRF